MRGSLVESLFGPFQRQADFHPEISIAWLPNQTQNKLKGWCFFSSHSIEDPCKIQVLTAKQFSRNAAVEATSTPSDHEGATLARHSRCLLHLDWLHYLTSSNQRELTVWLQMSLAVMQVVTWFSPKGDKLRCCFGPFQINLSIAIEILVRTYWGCRKRLLSREGFVSERSGITIKWVPAHFFKFMFFLWFDSVNGYRIGKNKHLLKHCNPSQPFRAMA